MMKRSIKLTLSGIFLLLACNNSNAESSLTIQNAWIAEAPPVSKVLAAYMDIENNGSTTVTIHSIQSKTFDRIEIHRTFHENDVAKMKHFKQLAIPPAESLSFLPGGYHLMLFNPDKKLHSGDKIIFTINTSAGQQDITAIVRKSNTTHLHHAK